MNQWPGSYTGGDNDRGCWQITGSYYQISGIVVRNCTNGSNAAGIRTINSDHVTIRDVLFEHNDAGFSGSGENTLIEFSEFNGNGRVSSPPQHNIYVFGGSFTLRFSYVHDSVGGQNFHIRARTALLESNWFARAANYEGDMMTSPDDAHAMIFRGNVVLGNPNPANGSTVITLYNDDGRGGVSMNLIAAWNTFVVQGGSSTSAVRIVNDSLSSASVVFSNNILVGAEHGVTPDNPGNSNFTISGTSNWLEMGTTADDLTNTLFGSDPGFRDPAALDFTLAAGSSAIDGANGTGLTAPSTEYFRDETVTKMFRARSSAKDLGAFESTTQGTGYGPLR